MATATATDELLAGRKDCRLETAITRGLDAAITERAKELAGETGSPKMFRSAAARDLLARGVLAARKERSRA
jgi:hypothetical protein